MSITAAQLLVKVGGDTSGAENALGSLNSKLSGAAKGMAKTGVALSAAFTAPVMGIAAASLNAAAQFEQSFNMLGVVSGASESAMASLQAQALELGRATSFSAGEAAEAMLELSKAGMSTEQVSSSIAGVLDLAAASGMGLAQSAETVANSLNAFNLEASQAAMVSDLLAAAANASSVDMTDLTAAFRMSSAVFASSGQSIQDMTTALALLGNNALKGSDAGTSLKTMMMRLTAPTDEAARAMNDLGVNVFTAEGAMRPFGDIVADLGSAVSGLTDKQKAQAMATIFGADAVRAANILVAEGTSGWNEMSAAVTAAGAAQEAAGARMSGLTGAMEYLKGSIDSLLISVGLPFLDFLGGILRGVADAASAFGTLSPPVQQLIFVMAGLAAVAGPVLLALSGVAAALSLLLSPMGLVVAAVAGLGLAFATDFMGIRTAVMNVVNAVRPHFEQLLSWIDSASQGDWGPLKAGLQGTLQSVKATIEAFSWSDFITPLQDWSTYITTVAWRDYVTNLDWKAIITTVLDWGTFIPALLWNSFVAVMDFATYVNVLVWKEFISKLTWSNIVTALTNWDDFVGSVDWSGHIAALTDWAQFIGTVWWESFITKANLPAFVTMVDWGQFITAITDWRSYIPSLTWPVMIQEFSWSVFVPNLDWPSAVGFFEWEDFVPRLAWPEGIFGFSWGDFIPDLNWPSATQTFSWSTFVPNVNWPLDKIRSFDWSRFIPTIRWPAGLGAGKPSENASGTNFFGGGLTWVGERGPELVALPHGSRIYDSVTSTQMAGGITVNINNPVMKSDMDIESLAYRLRQELRRA